MLEEAYLPSSLPCHHQQRFVSYGSNEVRYCSLCKAVEAEREACMKAECEGCREGQPFNSTTDCHDWPDVARGCDALGIRARSNAQSDSAEKCLAPAFTLKDLIAGAKNSTQGQERPFRSKPN